MANTEKKKIKETSVSVIFHKKIPINKYLKYTVFLLFNFENQCESITN